MGGAKWRRAEACAATPQAWASLPSLGASRTLVRAASGGALFCGATARRTHSRPRCAPPLPLSRGRGPRIRMGVHWATEGTVVQRLHQITKHRVFTGPAFQVRAPGKEWWRTRAWHGRWAACPLGEAFPIPSSGCLSFRATHTPSRILSSHSHPLTPLCSQVARELSEAAQGGQVLLSHEGWVRLRQVSRRCCLPLVRRRVANPALQFTSSGTPLHTIATLQRGCLHPRAFCPACCATHDRSMCDRCNGLRQAGCLGLAAALFRRTWPAPASQWWSSWGSTRWSHGRHPSGSTRCGRQLATRLLAQLPGKEAWPPSPAFVFPAERWGWLRGADRGEGLALPLCARGAGCFAVHGRACCVSLSLSRSSCKASGTGCSIQSSYSPPSCPSHRLARLPCFLLRPGRSHSCWGARCTASWPLPRGSRHWRPGGACPSASRRSHVA